MLFYNKNQLCCEKFCLNTGYIYVIGGCNDKGMLRTVEQYSMEEERWTHSKKLDRPLQSHAAAAHGELVTYLSVYYYLHVFKVFFIHCLTHQIIFMLIFPN